MNEPRNGKRDAGNGNEGALRIRSAFPLLLLLAAPTVRAQEPQYFQAPSGKPRLTFQWDALARYDSIYHLKRPAPLSNEIERGRFEFRPELDLVFSDRFKLGVRAVGDLGTDRNEENAINFDNYRSRGAALDRFYVQAKPGPVTILAGSFEMPLVATEMLWDRDIQSPGVAAAWQIPAATSSFTLAAAGFLGPQREGDRTRVGAAQVVWRLGDASRLALEAAASYWHFDPERLKAAYIRQNYFQTRGGQRDYRSRYRMFDGILRLRFAAGAVPMTLSLDVASNTGVAAVANDERSAFEGSLVAGRVGLRGDWRVFFTYQYVQRDAVLGAYNTDDWWFHSWYRGSRVGIAYTVLPQVFVQGAVVFQKRLDATSTLNRITLDLVKMF